MARASTSTSLSFASTTAITDAMIMLRPLIFAATPVLASGAGLPQMRPRIDCRRASQSWLLVKWSRRTTRSIDEPARSSRSAMRP
jgi:hypothetical protein